MYQRRAASKTTQTGPSTVRSWSGGQPEASEDVFAAKSNAAGNSWVHDICWLFNNWLRKYVSHTLFLGEMMDWKWFMFLYIPVKGGLGPTL